MTFNSRHHLARTAAIAALVVFASSMAEADTAWEVESARLNARAGGPPNAYDAELLQRYGWLNDTPVRDGKVEWSVRENMNSRIVRRHHRRD